MRREEIVSCALARTALATYRVLLVGSLGICLQLRLGLLSSLSPLHVALPRRREVVHGVPVHLQRVSNVSAFVFFLDCGDGVSYTTLSQNIGIISVLTFNANGRDIQGQSDILLVYSYGKYINTAAPSHNTTQ